MGCSSVVAISCIFLNKFSSFFRTAPSDNDPSFDHAIDLLISVSDSDSSQYNSGTSCGEIVLHGASDQGKLRVEGTSRRGNS